MEISQKNVFRALFVLLALGAVLRFAGLGTNSFVADEFLDINSTYGYHQTGLWKAWDFNYGEPAEMNVNDARDERAFVYKWQVAALFSFLPPTEGVARSVSALWGLFSILVVYWSALIFTRRREIGLVAALLCAVSVSAIVFSRRLRMYAMFFPLYLGFATAVYAAYELRYEGAIRSLRSLSERFGIHPLYAFLTLVFGILSASVHQLTLNLFISLGVYLVVRTVQEYHQSGSIRNKYGTSLALGVLVLILSAIFVPSVIRLLMNGFVFFEDHFGYLTHALSDFATPVIGVLLIILGAWKLFVSNLVRPNAALYLTLAYAVPLFMAVFMWNRNVGPQYIYFIQSFGMILAATGIVALFEWVREKSGPWDIRRTVFVGLCLSLLVPNLAYFFAENNTYHETSTGGNPNYRKVFTFVKKEKTEGDVLIARNFRNYYWSGAKLPVFDFGGELSDKKLSLADIQKIEAEHLSGWFVYSGNDEDYISADVEPYIIKNWERVSNANVRGDITVYRWGR